MSVTLDVSAEELRCCPIATFTTGWHEFATEAKPAVKQHFSLPEIPSRFRCGNVTLVSLYESEILRLYRKLLTFVSSRLLYYCLTNTSLP